MNVAKGDFVLLEGRPKPILGKCLSFDSNKGIVRVYKDQHQSEESGSAASLTQQVRFSKSDVLANLGRYPAPGTAYGLKIEPLVKTEPSKFWGTIRQYRWMNDDMVEGFRSQNKAFIGEIRARKLPPPMADLEIRPINGRMLGCYKYHKGKERDTLVVRPNDALDNMMYVFAHEYAHGIHYRNVPKSIWVKWIQAYHEFVTITNIDQSELDQILDEVHAAQSIKDYLKEATDDTKLVVLQALRYISQVHALGRHHIEFMLNAGESIENLWPLSLDLTQKELAISDYARKNVEEFFAESFAFNFVGRALPKKIEVLLDKTLRTLIR